MYIYKLADAAASKITVTSTATSLFDLIDTAGGSVSDLPGNLNAVDITVEDGDVRMLMDGNTPTSANGVLLSSGNVYMLRGVPLTKMQLIRVGGSNVTCSVQVGVSESGENSSASAFDVTLEASGITIGGVEAQGMTAHDAADSDNPQKIGGRASDSQIAAVAANDRTDAIFNLYGEQVMAGFDWASFFLAVGERDPIDRKCLLTSYSYSNVPNATPQTIEFEMQGFSDFSVHIEKTGGTDTFDVDYLASNEGTATTDDWIDITAGMTFVGGSATTDHIATPTIKFTPKAVQIEITTAGGSNDADFNVFIYKKY